MNDWLDDLRTAVAFLTRLPMPHPQGAMPANFVRAHRMFPLVGAAIGGAVGLLYLGMRIMGLPDLAGGTGVGRKRDPDRRAARGWPRRCRGRFRRRPRPR